MTSSPDEPTDFDKEFKRMIFVLVGLLIGFNFFGLFVLYAVGNPNPLAAGIIIDCAIGLITGLFYLARIVIK